MEPIFWALFVNSSSDSAPTAEVHHGRAIFKHFAIWGKEIPLPEASETHVKIA